MERLNLNLFHFEETIGRDMGKIFNDLCSKMSRYRSLLKNQFSEIFLNFSKLNLIREVGMENADNSYQITPKGWKTMLRDNEVMTTQEACQYLRISRPTFLKYIYVGRIKGAKAGKGWKVLKSELDRFLKGDFSNRAIG